MVAPLAGAWIEIPGIASQPISKVVAPLAGAWIEIWQYTSKSTALNTSRPSRARGLKCAGIFRVPYSLMSRPSRGAWIEIA